MKLVKTTLWAIWIGLFELRHVKMVCYVWSMYWNGMFDDLAWVVHLYVICFGLFWDHIGTMCKFEWNEVERHVFDRFDIGSMYETSSDLMSRRDILFWRHHDVEETMSRRQPWIFKTLQFGYVSCLGWQKTFVSSMKNWNCLFNLKWMWLTLNCMCEWLFYCEFDCLLLRQWM